MTGIFISHSKSDRDRAHNLAMRLRERGHEPFLDFESIDGGASWQTEIHRALRKSAAVLLCASPAAMESRWVSMEIAIAQYAGHPVIPLVFAECSLPAFLRATTQVIDFTLEPAMGWERLWKALARLDLAPAAVWEHDRCPYPGLAALDESHHAVFFGRQLELEQALAALRPGGLQHRSLTLVGPSGCGKSSLLRAGIVHALKRGALEGSESWTFVPTFTPGEVPFRHLAEKLLSAGATGDLRQIEQRLREPEGLLYQLLTLRAGAETDVVLVIDQLEEIERRTPRADADAFLEQLEAALTARESPVRVLATLRADFLSACLQMPALAGLLRSVSQPIGAMDRAALRRVILGPAEITGVEFEAGLVEEILDDTRGGDALPLLAHVLRELWPDAAASGKRSITRSRYAELGGVEGALVSRAESLYGRTPEEHRDELRKTLVRLADVNDHGDFTRRRERWSIVSPQIHATLEDFVDERLLVTSGGKGDDAVIEVTHEALLRSWPRLRGWLEDESDRLRLRRRIELDAAEWARNGEDPDYLWTGERLAAAVAILETERWPDEDRRARFLSAGAGQSQLVRERESALLARRVLSEIHTDPERAVLLALAAIEEYAPTEQAHWALGFACFAARSRTLWHGEEVQSAYFSHGGDLLVTCAGQEAIVWDIATKTPTRRLHHEDEVSDAAFSEDDARIISLTGSHVSVWDARGGTRLCSITIAARQLSWSSDASRLLARTAGSLGLFDGATGREIWIKDWNGPASPELDRSGQRIAVVTGQGIVEVWHAESGELICTSPSFGADSGAAQAPLSPRHVAFDRDGARIVSVSNTAAVVWCARTGSRLLTIDDGTRLELALFTMDGSRFVTLSDGGVSRHWCSRTGECLDAVHDGQGEVSLVKHGADGPPISRNGNAFVVDHHEEVIGADLTTGRKYSFRHFDPSGDDCIGESDIDAAATLLVTTPDDGTARVWDFPGGDVEVLGPDTSPTCLDVSNDGSRLLVGSHDGLARVSETLAGDELARFRHDDGVLSAQFSSDATRVLTTEARAAVLWDSGSGKRVRTFERDGMLGASLCSDDQAVLATFKDHTVQIWSIDGDGPAWTLEPDDPIQSVDVRRRGTLAMTASNKGLVHLWEIRTGHLLRTLDLEDHIDHAAFDPAGRYIVAFGSFTTRVWDAESGRSMLAVNHDEMVEHAALSSDGQRLATATGEAARVWNTETSRPCLDNLIHAGEVTRVAFSHDGKLLATACNNSTLRIWEVESGIELLQTSLEGECENELRFGPDDRSLFAMDDDFVYIVRLRTGTELVALAKRRVTRSLSRTEREQYGLRVD